MSCELKNISLSGFKHRSAAQYVLDRLLEVVDHSAYVTNGAVEVQSASAIRYEPSVGEPMWSVQILYLQYSNPNPSERLSNAHDNNG